MTKRLLVCGACLATMVAVVVSVAMAIGIELQQRSKQCDSIFRV